MIDKKVFSESYAVILALGEYFINRLPSDVFELIKSKSDSVYIPKIDQDKPLNEQGLLKDTMVMIAMLRLEYWCNTEGEKAKFLAHLEANEEKLKETLRKTASTRELLRLIGKE